MQHSTFTLQVLQKIFGMHPMGFKCFGKLFILESFYRFSIVSYLIQQPVAQVFQHSSIYKKRKTLLLNPNRILKGR